MHACVLRMHFQRGATCMRSPHQPYHRGVGERPDRGGELAQHIQRLLQHLRLVQRHHQLVHLGQRGPAVTSQGLREAREPMGLQASAQVGSAAVLAMVLKNPNPGSPLSRRSCRRSSRRQSPGPAPPAASLSRATDTSAAPPRMHPLNFRGVEEVPMPSQPRRSLQPA